MKNKQITGYKMMYCSVEQKLTAHKVYWTAEIHGLKIRYHASFFCGKCQWGLIDAHTQAGIFHDKPSI